VLINKPQTLPLPGGEQAERIDENIGERAHMASSKRRLRAHVYFKAKGRTRSVNLRPMEAVDMDPRDADRPAQLELAIGVRMRTRRRQLGLSQTQLADALGVSFQQVQKYERGANRVAASTLLLAAQTLNISVGWLLGEEATGREDDDDVFRALARPGAMEILQAFNLIPGAGARTALLALAREMAGPPEDEPA
jgi:transcriptional regulator with XRE-family HTH domain